MNARDFLETIVLKCPAYSVPLPDCALSALHSPESLKEKLNLLTESEMEDLVRRHFLCLCRKEGCGS